MKRLKKTKGKLPPIPFDTRPASEEYTIFTWKFKSIFTQTGTTRFFSGVAL